MYLKVRKKIDHSNHLITQLWDKDTTGTFGYGLMSILIIYEK